jgi:hypothetical protein
VGQYPAAYTIPRYASGDVTICRLEEKPLHGGGRGDEGDTRPQGWSAAGGGGVRWLEGDNCVF